ncbi:MAG: hypothetical protein QE265_12565 [Rhodoferax sp.]|nr:hypothetical protein [Rhodoferax sp.]
MNMLNPTILFTALNAAGITHGTAGAWDVKAATQHTHTTGKRLPVAVPTFASAQLPPSPHDVQVQYHDNEPVQGAAFRIDYADGRSTQGQLDASGRADLSNAPQGAGTLHWGEDQRPFAPKSAQENSQYLDKLTEADMQVSLKKAGDNT